MELTLTLTLDQVNTCLMSLSKQSWDAVNDTILTIKTQAESQIKQTDAPEQQEMFPTV